MGLFFALLTALLWALYNITVRRGMQLIGTGAGYLLTLGVGLLTNLLLLPFPLPGRQPGLPVGTAVLWFILAGVSTTLVGRWVYFQAIETLGPSRASAWKSVSPIYTLVLAAFWFGEIPGPTAVLGTISATVGLVLLSREQKSTFTASLGAGALRLSVIYGLASGVAFSAGMLARRAGLLAYDDGVMASTIGAVTALLVYTPHGAFTGEIRTVLTAPRAGVRAFILAGIFGGLATLTTFLALREMATATTQVVVSLEPVLTMAISPLLLGSQELLNRRVFSSAALVCTGVLLTLIG